MGMFTKMKEMSIILKVPMIHFIFVAFRNCRSGWIVYIPFIKEDFK